MKLHYWIKNKSHCANVLFFITIFYSFLLAINYFLKTFAWFDFLKIQYVVVSMTFSANIATLMPCCYFHHHNITHHHHCALDFNLSPREEVSSQLWIYFFQSLISYSIRLIIQCESCTLVFKSNLTLVVINHDQQS
jgi:hypothetical protein